VSPESRRRVLSIQLQTTCQSTKIKFIRNMYDVPSEKKKKKKRTDDDEKVLFLECITQTYASFFFSMIYFAN
jgi:hypothetical protein